MMYTTKQNKSQSVRVLAISKIKMNLPYVQPGQGCIRNFTDDILMNYFLCTGYYPREQVMDFIRDVNCHFWSVGTCKLVGEKEK